MNKYLIALIVVVLVAGGWWLWNSETMLPSQTPPTIDPKLVEPTLQSVDDDSIVRGPSSPDRKVYTNQDWRFSFEYPENWNVRTPEFGSPVSLFNLGLYPNDKPGVGLVVVNLTPKYWIENALVKMRARGVTTTDIIIDGRSALRLDDKDRISRPSTLFLVLVDDEFWIAITGVRGYEEEYKMILDSFEFLD